MGGSGAALASISPGGIRDNVNTIVQVSGVVIPSQHSIHTS